MRQMFKDFRALIAEGLRAETQPGELLKQAPDAPLYERFLATKERILDLIHFSGCSGLYQKGITLQLQKSTTFLLNELFEREEEEKAKAFYTLAEHSLLELLRHLEQYHSRTFDREEVMPLCRIAEAGQMLEQKLPLICAGLKKRQIDPELQKVVLEPFIAFGTRKNSRYQQMDYLLKLAGQLIECMHNPAANNDSLLSLLLYQGFNTPAFIRYFEQKMSDTVKADYQADLQLEAWYDYERRFRTIPKNPKARFDSRKPSLRTAILDFVQAEMQCLHKKQKLHSHAAAEISIANKEAAFNRPYRIKTSLSVEGLAYFLRLMIETGAIEAEPRTALMAFVAANIQTRGKDGNISVQSLQTKYKQVNQHTAKGIKSLLNQMNRQVKARFDI